MARQQAEQEATKITVAAEAEKEAAQNKAQAIKISAQAEADAAKIAAEAQEKTYAVEAEGQRKINEARNAMSAAVIELEITRERLRILPIALAEAVKPLEKIGEVRIIDMGGGGIGGALAGNGAFGTGGGGGKADSLVDALLAYRAQSPVIDSLLKEAGFTAGGNPVQSLISAVKSPANLNGGAVAPADEAPKH
jgi:flotillin